jgi:hypothetical protein
VGGGGLALVPDLLVHRPDSLLVYGLPVGRRSEPPAAGLGAGDRPLAGSVAWCLVRRPPGWVRAAPVVGLAAALVATQTLLLVAPLPTSVPVLVSTILVFFLAVAWLGGRVEAAAR